MLRALSPPKVDESSSMAACAAMPSVNAATLAAEQTKLRMFMEFP
jgi:hypothetical protein